MQVTINPITERLKETVKQHGATGWVILRNDPACQYRAGAPASLVCKDNKLLWLTNQEIEHRAPDPMYQGRPWKK